MRSADFYEQRCVKYPHRACFHCYAEFIHALLLEAAADVSTFVPQPFALQVNRRYYIPDVYVVRQGLIEVLELKPRGELDAELETPLRAFFEQYGMTFRVLANETVLGQETLALNWLPLIQVLAQARYQGLVSDEDEARLLASARNEGEIAVGKLLSDCSRKERFWSELALYRLLHHHALHCDLTDGPLDYNTVVSAWN